MLCLVRYRFVISTSVIDCLGRFVPEMTYYVLSGTLNLTKLKLKLIPTSMTLNDLERCNSPYFVFFSPNSIALPVNYITVVEDRPIMSVKYCLPVTVFHFWP